MKSSHMVVLLSLVAIAISSFSCASTGSLAGEWERVTQAPEVGMPDIRGMSLQELNRALQENLKEIQKAGAIKKALRNWSYRIEFKRNGVALLYREEISNLEEVQYSISDDRITFKSQFGNASYKFSLKGSKLVFFDMSSQLEVEYRRK